jgi:hypothetical protein
LDNLLPCDSLPVSLLLSTNGMDSRKCAGGKSLMNALH